MLILIAHGSRDPRWRSSLELLTATVQQELAPERVRLAYMQFTGPDLGEVVTAGIRDGTRSFRLLPLFMASAGHVDKDIRPLVQELALRHPEAQLVILTPVGEDPRFPELIRQIATEAPPGS